MERILYAVLLLYLALETDSDIRRKEISTLHWMVAGGILFCAGCIWSGWESVLGGMIPGILLIAVSAVTGGAVGSGDGMVLMVCGIVLGVKKVGLLLVLALFLMFPISLGKLVFQRIPGNTELAFLPYLLSAYMVLLLECFF